MRKMLLLLLLLFTAVQATCGTGWSAAQKPQQAQPKEVVVFAAASLTECFGELAGEFEKQEAGKLKVVFNFAGSQTLKTSIENGARADVFASAGNGQMEELKAGGFIEDYSVFARNRLVVIKNKLSTYRVSGFEDLAKVGLRLAVGDKSAPVGAYWEETEAAALKDGLISEFDKVGIERNIKTRELNVKDVVAKVLLNEADAGIAYKTDVTAAVLEKAEVIELEPLGRVEAEYPAAVLKSAAGRSEAVGFLEFLLSDKGRAVLKKYGFSVN